MKRSGLLLLSLFFAAALSLALSSPAPAYLLDADVLGAGSYTSASPLTISTPLGSVSFVGEIRDPDGDPEFTLAGASGNVFDILDNPDSYAYLTFSFEIVSATFIYGGNAGVFDIEARDIGGNVVASFFQASTDGGQPAGPVTLSGPGIRSLYWEDPGWSLSAMDNLDIETAPVPLPGTMVLLGSGLAGFAAFRRKRRTR